VVAAATLGHPATVVVPMSTKKMMIEMIERAGGQVIQYGANWKEADGYLRETAIKNDPNGVYVPPFDHEDIWEGHSSLVDELLVQMRDILPKAKKNGTSNGAEALPNAEDIFPSAIVCSVGGGGLFAGIMRGLDRYEGAEQYTNVIAVETKGAASLYESLAHKNLITLPGITSAAHSLGAVRVAAEAFKHAQRSNVHTVTLSDADAEAGCVKLAETDRFVVELACGVNVAMCRKDYLQKALGREVRKEEKIVIVVCGGSNVTVDMLAQWKVDVLQRQAQGVVEEMQVIHGGNC
jgi:L-serine/L-threonine ammonia-lyase